jgi:intracellular sulfur oxidation DsrE/DsrF family protein
LRNLLADLGEENVEVELLTNGTDVTAMRKDNESNNLRIHYLASQGVKFAVCANLLKYLEISSAELVPEADIVPEGVSELVKRQING